MTDKQPPEPEIVYQERYSGAAVGQWRTIDKDEFDTLADAKLTERRRLVVVENVPART